MGALTKYQKIKAYQFALQELMYSPHYCVCPFLRDYCFDNFHIITSIPLDFPEFYSYKPEDKNITQRWFPLDSFGSAIRIDILTTIINSLK